MLLDMAFAVCVVNTHGGQWTGNDSKMNSDSGKYSDIKNSTSSDADEEASSDKTESAIKEPAKKTKRISWQICKEFVDKCKELKKPLEELEEKHKACEALGEWMDKREKERQKKMSSITINKDSDEEEAEEPVWQTTKEMASEFCIVVWNKN